MTLNGSGLRDSARVLQVGPNTGMKEVKASGLSRGNPSVGEGCGLDARAGEVRRGEAAEVEERWRFVRSEAHQRGLWHALDPWSEVVLASAVGSRADKVFGK